MGYNNPFANIRKYIMKEMPLTQGLVAFVDDDDYEKLSCYNWYVNHYGYAVRSVKGDCNKKIFMHREILGVKTYSKIHVDHINRNTIDNRKENLRECNRSENQSNRSKQSNNKSGYKGVSWAPWAKKWRAQIGFKGTNKKLGYFSTPEAAHDAYCIAAKNLHKEFARTE